MTTTKFKTALDQGSALVVKIDLTAGRDRIDYPTLAGALSGRVAAALVSDNPGAAVSVPPLVAAGLLKNEGLETIVTLSARDRNRLALASQILGARDMGLDNILAVSGDHPALGPIPEAKPVYDLDSVQLLELIREANQGRIPGGPDLVEPTDIFAGALVNPESNPVEGQRAKLRLKARAGAGFIMTQAVFDLDRFSAMAETARELGLKILAGLRIFGPEEVGALAKKRLPGINPPQDLIEDLQAEPDAVLEKSAALAQKTANGLKDRADGFVVMAPGSAEGLPDILNKLGLG